jgi:hypothetical protein
MSAALAAALLAVTVLAPAARANTPGSGLGVNGWYLFWEMPQSQWNLQVTEMAADGIQVARADAFWSSVEPNAPGANGPQYNWTTTDAIATVLAEHGVRWLPIIDYSAPWAESVAGNIKSPPNNDAAYAAYAAAVVARYGPGGTFWAENPSLTPEPVTGVEIWNEPNVADSAIPAPQYAVLYEDARTAIHAVDPSVQAIVGGLVNPANQYLEQMYAALGGPGKIDAVGQHPYDVSVAATVADMKRLRIAMDNEGDANVPIDITEFGWPTSGSASWSTTLTDATRAVDLTQAIDQLGKSDCGIERILPYSWVTAQSNSADVGDFFGLVSPDGSPTLSSAAMAAEYKLLEASNSGSAGNDACGRPLTLKLTSVASTSPTTNSCVTASVLTWSAAGSATVGVAGATVSFTSPAATTATTGSNGQATVCWSLPVGHTASVSAKASQQYFYPQPQASLSILPGTTATVATVKPKPEVKPNTKPKSKAAPKPKAKKKTKAKKKATKKPKKRKRKPATKCVAGKHKHKHKTCRTKRQQRRGAKRK